jgi:hypothetical protein
MAPSKAIKPKAEQVSPASPETRPDLPGKKPAKAAAKKDAKSAKKTGDKAAARKAEKTAARKSEAKAGSRKAEKAEKTEARKSEKVAASKKSEEKAEPKKAAKGATGKSHGKHATGRIASVTPEQRHHMIREAAYYLAERNGFCGTDPHGDWVRAEAEIDLLLSGKS